MAQSLLAPALVACSPWRSDSNFVVGLRYLVVARLSRHSSSCAVDRGIALFARFGLSSQGTARRVSDTA
jgi:hypothetical protein